LYTTTTDERSQPQIDALPSCALAPLAELRTMLEVAPWNGAPYSNLNPDSPMRVCWFGHRSEGMVVYLILDDQRRVDLLEVLWAG
jgi:hypothetical protein